MLPGQIPQDFMDFDVFEGLPAMPDSFGSASPIPRAAFFGMPASGDLVNRYPNPSVGKLSGGAMLYALLGGAYSNATTGFTDVTAGGGSILFVAASGGTYHFSIFIQLSAFTGTGGVIYQFTGPTVSAMAVHVDGTGTAATALANSEIVAAMSTPTANAHHAVAAGTGWSRIDGVIVATSTATFQLQAKAGAGATTVNIDANSYLRVWRQI